MNLKNELSVAHQKLELLQVQVLRCQNRIAALEALIQSENDAEFDALLEKRIREPSDVALHQNATNDALDEEQVANNPSPQKIGIRKDSKWPQFVKRLGKEGASLDELEAFAKSLGGKPQSRANLRTMMMKLRNIGYVEDTGKPGFYRASKEGLDAVASIQEESRTDVVGANDNGAAFSLQPSPTRDNNIKDLL